MKKSHFLHFLKHFVFQCQSQTRERKKKVETFFIIKVYFLKRCEKNNYYCFLGYCKNCIETFSHVIIPFHLDLDW